MSYNPKGQLEEWRIHGTASHTTLAGPRPEQQGRKKRYHLPYEELEAALLANLVELDVRGLVDGSNERHAQLDALRGKVASLAENMAATIAGLKKRYSDALAEILADQELEHRQLSERLEKLEQENRHSAEDSIDDLRDLVRRLEWMEGEELLALRKKLKARIKQTVSSIVVRHVQERTEQDRTVVLLLGFWGFNRIRQINVDIRRSPTGKGNVWETKTAHWERQDSGAWEFIQGEKPLAPEKPKRKKKSKAA